VSERKDGATFTGWDILKDIEFDSELAERLLPAVRSAACGVAP